MSASEKNRKLLFPALTALAVLLAISFFVRSGTGPSQSSASGEAETVVQEDKGETTAEKASEHAQSHAHDPQACPSCSGKAGANQSVSIPTTQARYDSLFKQIAKGETFPDREWFDRIQESSVGDKFDFEIGGLTFSGTVAVARRGETSRAHVLDFPEGNLKVTTDRVGKFRAYLMLNGDSRVVMVEESKVTDLKRVQGSGAGESIAKRLKATEIAVSDVYCAPPGTVFPLNGPQSKQASTPTVGNLKAYAPLQGPVAAVSLNSDPDAEHVLYLDFDGETVTGDAWNIDSGVDPIIAVPAPRANDDEWVANVWRRVVEDLAPFDINVTTDRAVFDAAPIDRRLMAICTPTDTAFPNTGGVAFLFSYATDFTDIVWVYNLSEYSCASTISHEAGHAFGLFHDGQPGGDGEYYEGHNGSYAPGWAPIMGFPEGGGLADEVDQWSIGEYPDANNQEDDLAIIGGVANGFGFREDDFANAYNSGTPSLDVGLLTSTGPNKVGGSGLISQTGDLDVFRFTAQYDGPATFTVRPLDINSSDTEPGSNTSGANLAAQIRILDEDGLELATGADFGANLLSSQVTVNLAPGIYYLEVDGGGRGDDPETGFSDYASLGVYTIEGDLPTPPLAIFGSAPDRDANGKITGPGKMDQAVLLGDTSISLVNGTDFGFSYPSNSAIVHQFIVANTGSTPLTNVSFSLASGVDFQILSAPGATLPGNSQTFLYVAYDPTASGAAGIDSDTVIVNYDSFQPETFEFAIGGLSTKSATQDNYEINNVFNQAYDLNAVENTWLSDYKGPAFFISYPDDFFTFNVSNGELVTVEVNYDGSEGPVLFELYNGFNTLLGSTSATDGRILFLVPNNFTSAQRKFYIRASIEGDSSVRSLYDLKWSSVSAGVGGDDFYEENDSQSNAFDLTGAFNTRLSDFLGPGILNDEDWYKIEIPADPFIRMFYVRAEFVHAEGNIDIQLIADNEVSGFGSYDGTGTSEADYEVLSYYDFVDTEDYATSFTPEGNVFIMGVPPGTYYVRVFGDLAGNEYDLVVAPLRDDAYEVTDEPTETENDNRFDATQLGSSIIGRWLSEVDGIATTSDYGTNATADDFNNLYDQDWYSISFEPGQEVQQLVIDYVSSGGGTQIFQVYDSSGTRVGRSFETVGNVTTYFGLGQIIIPNPEDTTYLIQVEPFSEVDYLSAYDFRVTTSNVPVVLDVDDDLYEENDNFTELYDISDNQGFWLVAKGGYGIQLDPDWYEITVPEGASRLVIQATYDPTEGDVDLVLSRKDGPVLFRSEEIEPEPTDEEGDEDIPFDPNGTGVETIIWDNPDAGDYAVTILGSNTGTRYNLYWDVDFDEDNYEENDTRATAFDISGHEKQLLSKLDGFGVQADEDWYQISVTAARAELRILSFFQHAEGDIDIELYNSAGFLLARSVSSTDDEVISVLDPAIDDYFIRVYYGNAGNDYELWWGAFTQTELDAISEDAYEEDDSQGAATVLPIHTFLSEISGPATQTDDDWFQITIGEGSIGFQVDCSFTHAEGDIDIEVYDADGAVFARAASQTDDEMITYGASLPAGNYNIRVYGANLGNSYDLYWIDYREDAYEQNDVFAEAYNFNELRQTPLSDFSLPTQGDDDWYQFTADDPGSVLTLEIDYSDPDGSIFFEVYDSDENLLTSDLSTDEQKYLLYALPSAGDFFIRVFGDDNWNEYDLTWNAVADDAFEENDSLGAAANLTADDGLTQEGISLDPDWFVFDPPYGAVSVQLDLTFTHENGDIDVNVYDENENLIAQAFSVDDNESLLFGVNPFGGQYYIEVVTFGNYVGNDYTLNWTSIFADASEDNETLATATDLTAFDGGPLSTVMGFASSADEDWYVIQPTAANLNVYCRFDHAQGNIDINLYGPDENFLAQSISTTDDESIATVVVPGDLYYIRVFGDLAGNPYDLSWNSYDVDDAFEENDVDGDAADIIADEYLIVTDLIQIDDDWYEIEAQAGDQLLLAVIDTNGTIQDLTLELYDGSVTLVDSVNSSDASPRVEAVAPTAGSYYLRVSGPNLADNYRIWWSSGSDDSYEENDSLATAFDLSGDAATPLSSLTGSGAQYDEDWYQITLPLDDSTLSATLTFLHDEGDLSLTLVDSAGETILVADDVIDLETFSLNGLAAGDYYLVVDGPDIGTIYDLEWNGYVDDNYEDNDALSEAYDLGTSLSGTLSPIDGLGVRGVDLDYFLISNGTGGYVTLTVDCTFLHADGDIKIEIFDNGGNSLGTADSADDNESLTVNINPNEDSFYILVSGADDTGTTYDLDWSFDSIDNYEDNDTTGTPTDFSNDEDTLLSDVDGFGTQEDVDYYLLTLPVNSRDLTVDLFFEHANGDINMAILDSTLTTIATAVSTTDNESIVVSVDPAGGDYLIEVSGANSGNFYNLIWSVSVDDAYEENDTSATPADLSLLDGVPLSGDLGLGQLLDEDWYSFTTPVGQVAVNVLVDGFLNSEGNIDLELYDASDNLIASSTSGFDFESVEAAVDPAGELLKVRVFGVFNENSYDFTWTSLDVDRYEENDFVEEAYDLSSYEGVWLDTIDGFASQNDDDWYQLVASTGSTTLTIEATFTHADGDIDLELYKLDPVREEDITIPGLDQRKPTLVAREASLTDNETLIYDVTGEPGIYFVRVYFGNAGNVYNLRWDDALVDTSGDDIFINDFWFFGEGGGLVPELLQSPTANADNDAFPNWAEYALALNGELADTVTVDQSTTEIEGETYFTITFLRSSDAVTRGFQFYVEESSDLSFDGSLAVLHSVVPLDDGIEQVTYRCSADMSEAPQCFFKIRVEAPEKSF